MYGNMYVVESAIAGIAETLQSAALKGTICSLRYIYFQDILSYIVMYVCMYVGGSQTSLKRANFIEACSNIHILEELSSKQLSIMFSTLDPMKT